MTSYTHDSNVGIKIFIGFEKFCVRVPSFKFGGDWTTNIRETLYFTKILQPEYG